MSGRSRIIDLATSQTHEIRPGGMDALDQHGKHTLIADEDVVTGSLNPPVTGPETHREDGSYAPAD